MNAKILEERKIEDVVAEYSHMVYRLAFAKTRSNVDADDICQEVFLRYIRKHLIFESEEHRKAWLLRVTANCSKTLLNSIWRKRTEPLGDDLLFHDPELGELHRELAKLPDIYRVVLHLFYYEDLTTEEISKILRRRESTVRTQLTRARRMLKAELGEEYYV